MSVCSESVFYGVRAKVFSAADADGDVPLTGHGAPLGGVSDGKSQLTPT